MCCFLIDKIVDVALDHGLSKSYDHNYDHKSQVSLVFLVFENLWHARQHSKYNESNFIILLSTLKSDEKTELFP